MRQVALLAAAFSAVVLAFVTPQIANLAFSPVVRAPCSCFRDNFSPREYIYVLTYLRSLLIGRTGTGFASADSSRSRLLSCESRPIHHASISHLRGLDENKKK